jgi:hypothetical protein
VAEAAAPTKGPAPSESVKAQPAAPTSLEQAPVPWAGLRSGASSVAAAAAAEADPRSLVWLQRSAGNRAVLQALGATSRGLGTFGHEAHRHRAHADQQPQPHQDVIQRDVGFGGRVPVEFNFDLTEGMLPGKEALSAGFFSVTKASFSLKGYVDIGEKGDQSARAGPQAGSDKKSGLKIDATLAAIKTKEKFLDMPASIALKGAALGGFEKSEISASVEARLPPLVVEGKLTLAGVDYSLETIEKNGKPQWKFATLGISGGGIFEHSYEEPSGMQVKLNGTATLGLEFAPNWGRILRQVGEQYSKALLRNALRNMLTAEVGLAGAGIAITVASTLAALDDWDEIKAIGKAADDATTSYVGGYVGTLAGGKSSAATGAAAPGSGSGAFFDLGLSDATKKLDEIVTKLQQNPAFQEYGFTAEELKGAMAEMIGEQAAALGEQVRSQNEQRIKIAFLQKWKSRPRGLMERFMGTREVNEKYVRTYLGLPLEGPLDADAEAGAAAAAPAAPAAAPD